MSGQRGKSSTCLAQGLPLSGYGGFIKQELSRFVSPSQLVSNCVKKVG